MTAITGSSEQAKVAPEAMLEVEGEGAPPLAVARSYLQASKAPRTLRAYRSDWADFVRWCSEQGVDPLPASPETVCGYLSTVARAGARASTIQRRVSSISQAHQAAGQVPPPTQSWDVRQVLRGIRRTIGVAPHQKQALLVEQLRRAIAATPVETRAGARDRALLLVGFAGGFRRSELVALDIGDVEETEDGLKVTIRRSKSDQEGEGREIGIPWGSHPETCPVRAVRVWRTAGEVKEGSLWRRVDRHDRILPGRLGARAVALIVKRAVERSGGDPLAFSGHSLRSGFATSAAQAGAPERAIMRQTGHRSVQMVRRYIQTGTLFQENAAAYVDM